MSCETVLDFIEQFNAYEKESVLLDTFTKGFCYYFALMLQDRFLGEILYDPVIGHFITKIDSRFYDITGDVTERYILNDRLYKKSTWSKQRSIMFGCVYKTNTRLKEV